jgi:hypothetical protein
VGIQGSEFSPDESIIPSQEIQQEGYLPRVYGVDYSLEIFSSFNSTSFQNYVIEITANGTRHALDATDAARPGGNNYKFRSWLLQKMHNLSMGRLELQVIEKHLNVIGKLPGYLPGDNPVICIAGHYDSWFASHGANEGAAGIAVILELIEKLSRYEWPLDIYFLAANSRYVQWGPYGSGEVANWLYNEGIEPLVIYTTEALLVQDPYAPQDERLQMVYLDGGPSNYHKGPYLAELAETMSKNYGGNRIVTVPHYDFDWWEYRYMSHTYYVQRGYQNTLIGIESGFADDDAIRTISDEWNNPNYRYSLGAEMTAAIGGSIAFTMAREYGRPVEHRVNLELSIARSESYYMAINAPTTINVSSRWYGGNASFTLLDSNNVIVTYEERTYASPWETVEVFSQPVIEPGIYRLFIENIGASPVGFDLIYSYDTDSNGNGIMDSQEYWLDTSLFDVDDDGDTLSNAYEIILGTDPESLDSDSDQLPDQWEVENGLNPAYAPDAMDDADGDSLSNLQEYILGLNPFSADSDQDHLPDNWEIQYGLNPFVDDSQEDPDEDEKSNLDEYLDGTNPLVADVVVTRFPVEWIIAPSLVVILVLAYYEYNRHLERNWTEY